MVYIDWGYCDEEDVYIYSEVVIPVICSVIPEASEGDLWTLGKV